MAIKCYAALERGAVLKPFTYEPKPLGPYDVELAVTHCGLCHSDIHLIDNDWQVSNYPLIPGHEVVGVVRERGPAVTEVAIGQRVGVGWQSGACLQCEWCVGGDETCCPREEATCVGRPGGFAAAIRLDSRFVHPIPDGLASENAAPLLCAGITVYTPLRQGVQATSRVGIIGVGGLGHLAIQFARALGCAVTAFSTTPDKESEAHQLGAARFVNSRDAKQMASAAGTLDFLLSTITAPLEADKWLPLLRKKGTLCLVGASPGTVNVSPMAMIVGRYAVRGSAIGSRTLMREMLALAARHGVQSRTEVMPMAAVNAAIARVRRNEARYRVVLVS